MPLQKIKKTSSISSIWKAVVELLSSQPKVLVPFAVLAVIEIVVLWMLASSPHFPVNFVMARPISRIWGPIYLHYPFIYELLPRLFYYAKVVLSIIIGSLTSGMAVYMIFLIRKNQSVDLKAVFFIVLKRYVSLMILAIILFACVHFVMKEPAILLAKYFRAGHPKLLFLGPKFWFNIFEPCVGFLMAIVLQGLFVYAFPYIVIKGKKFLPALILGMRLFFKTAVKTTLLIMVPMFLYIPITILRGNTAILADKFGPEIICTSLFLGILVGTVVVDLLVTLVTTLLFIEATDEK